MGLLDRLEARARIEDPSVPLTAHNLLARFGGGETLAGVEVNERTVFGISPANACIRVLSETVGTLPCHLYERLERGRRRAGDHPLYKLLRVQPNPEINAQIFFEMAEAHLATWGNFYAEKQRRSGTGELVALWPLTPDRVTPRRRGGRKVFTVRLADSEAVTLPAEKVFHVWGLGYDGLKGYGPVRQARHALGLAKATEEYGSRYFRDGARFSGVLEHPATLTDKAYDRLQTSIQNEHAGLSNAHRIKILEEGMKYAQISFPPEDSQFLETRRFQVAEVARFFRMPLHKIQELERATFSNIEHQDIEFVRDTIRPWLVRFEMAILTQLLSDSDRDTYYAEFLLDSLLRGDTMTRHAAYASGIQNGYLSRNEVREFENLNPIEGGDELLVPLNMVEASADPEDDLDDDDRDVPGEERSATETRAQRSARSRYRLLLAFRPLIEEAASRMVAGEINAARRLLRQAANVSGGIDETFLKDLEQFHAEDFPTLAERSLLATFVALARAILVEIADEIAGDAVTVAEAERFAREHLDRYVIHHVEQSQGQIGGLLRDATTSDTSARELIEERLREWAETRAGKIGLREATWAASSFAVSAYVLAGVQTLRWNTFGKNCPLCNEMDGKIVEVTRTFVAKGEAVDPKDGETAPLIVKRTIRHPPLHDGCDCGVSPG